MRLISTVIKISGSNLELLTEEIKGNHPDATVIVFQSKSAWEPDKETIALAFEGDVYDFVAQQYANEDVTVVKV